ncbi:8-amino-7-oxononanoate synthase [Bacillus infantis]|jgi:MarR family transcriptional regulator, temperature-dependent positive regulator of motility|uniref:8-amino-7-oxononanoate synthase n=1 Tax=Bacillus infantis TaxID=324767 RepID=UPI003CF525D4
MKKISVLVMALLIGAVFSIKPAEAAYLPEYDKYVEVSYDEARAIADMLGLEGIELGEETAQITFEAQEKIIKKLEKLLKTEIDHYYVWLTVDGEKVLGFDPPVPQY